MQASVYEGERSWLEKSFALCRWVVEIVSVTEGSILCQPPYSCGDTAVMTIACRYHSCKDTTPAPRVGAIDVSFRTSWLTDIEVTRTFGDCRRDFIYTHAETGGSILVGVRQQARPVGGARSSGDCRGARPRIQAVRQPALEHRGVQRGNRGRACKGGRLDGRRHWSQNIHDVMRCFQGARKGKRSILIGWSAKSELENRDFPRRFHEHDTHARTRMRVPGSGVSAIMRR